MLKIASGNGHKNNLNSNRKNRVLDINGQWQSFLRELLIYIENEK